MKRASEAPFPYGSAHVCYFRLVDGLPEQVKGRPALREAVSRGDRLFAVWPGQYRSDLFEIDDPELLSAAIGPAKWVCAVVTCRRLEGEPHVDSCPYAKARAG